MPLTIADIRGAVAGGRWALSRHARERAGKRCIRDVELMHALADGEILEDYPDDPRGPSALLLGRSVDGRFLHAICASDPSGTILVITAYEPEMPGWLDERTRAPKGEQR